MASRKLRIEQHVRQRRDFLRGRLEQMRKTRIQKMKTIRERRLNQLQQGEKRREARSQLERRREMRR